MFGNLSRINRALVAVLFLVASASAESVGTFLQASFTDTVSVTRGQQSELVRVSGEIFILTDVNAPASSCTPAAVCASVPIATLRVVVGSGVGQTSGNK
ncbi:MAG: hypothetical protein WB384_21880, partial [Candidatus Sulfotelmatobacter sp.]